MDWMSVTKIIKETGTWCLMGMRITWPAEQKKHEHNLHGAYSELWDVRNSYGLPFTFGSIGTKSAGHTSLP